MVDCSLTVVFVDVVVFMVSGATVAFVVIFVDVVVVGLTLFAVTPENIQHIEIGGSYFKIIWEV